ncbi:MAG: aspartate-semialdehyde dehydrogenase [Planctomycetaceae bacterium]|jgi:aspartate-semialdehyde dehydrogenase|nr:aspartate-semialdehyde dehydrogenase [Planctomycetaceae bacterium]
MYESVAVVGATGAVGTIILDLLEKRNFPFKTIKFLASKRSAGKTVTFKGQPHTIEELTPDSFTGVQLAIASTPDETARDFVPDAVKRGTLVIDESGYWRMDPDVPLVIPEVNAAEAKKAKKGIISSPNCSTTQLVVAVKPLHDFGKVKRIVVSTYQAVSGAGLAGTRDLENGTKTALEGKNYDCECFPYPIAFNCIPQIGSVKEGAAEKEGYTSEELKLLYETRKILGDDTIRVCPTAVRVPVANGHSESILVETERKITAEKARELFAAMEGVIVMDDIARKKYPMPNFCTGRDEVFVGRIREDLSCENGLAFWCVSDNLRKGAATNAVQIAEWLQKN